jgi:hypothetical protein
MNDDAVTMFQINDDPFAVCALLPGK